jgi:hypothetical protein
MYVVFSVNLIYVDSSVSHIPYVPEFIHDGINTGADIACSFAAYISIGDHSLGIFLHNNPGQRGLIGLIMNVMQRKIVLE